MTVEAAMARRFSCRAFRSDPVPRGDLEAMFGIAQRTASWCNSQVWQVTLTSGAATDAFGRTLTDWVLAGNPERPDIAVPQQYLGVYRDRRRAAGFGLYQAVGIARDDTAGRQRQMLENFRFFGAPHVAVISAPAALGPYGAVDCGGYVSSLLTAAAGLGIDTIAQAAIALYADVVHRHLDIPDDRNIVCAVSLGYADNTHPANGFRTERAPISDAVTFVG